MSNIGIILNRYKHTKKRFYERFNGKFERVINGVPQNYIHVVYEMVKNAPQYGMKQYDMRIGNRTSYVIVFKNFPPVYVVWSNQYNCPITVLTKLNKNNVNVCYRYKTDWVVSRQMKDKLFKEAA